MRSGGNGPTAPSRKPGHGTRRQKRQQLSALQASGLLGLVLLCGGYIYFITHSPQLSQDRGFRRSSFRRQLGHGEQRSRSVRLGAVGREAGVFAATRGRADTWLLLASHNRLLQFNYISGNVRVVHEGKGVYYGIIPSSRVDAQGRPTAVWVVSRPHNWHPRTILEQLLEIDLDTGDELQAVKLDARFTHDMARRGEVAYVCSTNQGAILELSMPSLKQVGKLELFTAKEHVNSVAPLQDGSLWAILHNLGKARSELVKVDTKARRVVQRVRGIGTKSHGLVAWRGSLLVLDSEGGRLLRVNPHNGTSTTLYQVTDKEIRFLKGLAVIDDVAFFGIAVWQHREQRDDPRSDSKLAAFCLRGMTLLWRQTLPTHGLLNIIAAPHLAIASTYRALDPQLPRPKKELATGGMGSVTLRHAKGNLTRTAARTLADFPPVVRGSWASGQPRLDMRLKGGGQPLKAGMVLQLRTVDVRPLQDALASAGDRIWQEAEQRRSNAYFAGREAVLQHFKPGVETVHLVFSSRTGDTVYEFPWFNRFRAALEVVLAQLLGPADVAKIIRMQLARIRPGVHIKPHVDLGGWAVHSHRIHLPIVTSNGIVFEVCTVHQPTPRQHRRHAEQPAAGGDDLDCWPISTQQGRAFEVNNSLPHKVDNHSSVARVHLIVDVSELPHQWKKLQPGQMCCYEKKVIVCDH